MTDKKTVYCYHPETMKFIGEGIAYESPLEAGVFMIPTFCVEEAPNLEEGKITKWNGSQWINEEIEIPEIVVPELSELKQEKIANLGAAVSKKIYATYPIQKQINIGIRLAGYTTTDFNKMAAFINPILQFQDEKQTEINDCESSEELEAIEIDLEGVE